MSIPIKTGDILITTEIMRIRLGQINKVRLANDILFNVPKGFIEAATKALERHSETFTLNEYEKGNGKLLCDETREAFDMSTEIETSRRGFEMQWYVRNVNGDNYDLIAIGAGRTARIKDWETIIDIYRHVPISDDTPTLDEYVSVQGVDATFFDKKAVFRLNDSGEMEPVTITSSAR